MTISSCWAMLISALTLGLSGVIIWVLVRDVQSMLKTRQMSEFPFKQMIRFSASFALLIFTLLTSLSYVGTQGKTMYVAFKPLSVEKCKAPLEVAESGEEDEEGEEDIALISKLSC